MELFCEQAWLADGVARNVRLTIGADGFIKSVEPDAVPAGDLVPGLVLPGMVNAHSHAFQRALAGLTEYRAADRDSFWTWRQAMYDFTEKLEPPDVFTIACQLYGEMLKAGYSHVVEFHYLHHKPGGCFYEPGAGMTEAVIRAAEKTGIGLTLLPVLYQVADFGAYGPLSHQKRFVYKTDAYIDLIKELQTLTADMPNVILGIAFHSLRAVPEDALRTVLEKLPDISVIHIHIAEQEKEMETCLAHTGKRPVEWLLDTLPVDKKWSLVHAIHMTEAETERLAASGAAAVLCPTTEANLGDGFFPLVRYLEASGTLAIGGDSHVSVSPVEELRLLEYGQRLVHRARNLAAGGGELHTGAALWTMATAGGAQAAGIKTGRIAPGCRADLLALDTECAGLYGRSGPAILDSLIFSGNTSPVRDVMTGGKWRVRNGILSGADAILDSYKRTLLRLNGDPA